MSEKPLHISIGDARWNVIKYNEDSLHEGFERGVR